MDKKRKNFEGPNFSLNFVMQLWLQYKWNYGAIIS